MAIIRVSASHCLSFVCLVSSALVHHSGGAFVASQQQPTNAGNDGEAEEKFTSALLESGPPKPRDHRVMLHPGKWKIRTADKESLYLAYHFFLGSKWADYRVNYPKCSQVACEGLPDSHRACDHFCSTGTWRDATLVLETATLEYDRAVRSLGSTFSDLAALMDTHIIQQDWSSSDSVSKLLSYHGEESVSGPEVVDVMKLHRNLIEEALNNIVARRSAMLSPEMVHSVYGLTNTTKFNEMLDTWRSGAFKLAVQLNAATFAFQGAHQRLLLCAQGIQRLDMTGCEPGFIAELYTDVPMLSRSLSSSRLVMVVRRENWNTVTLSRWFMPFIDSSSGNRTCWLARPMVSDERANYRVPLCDSRGLCEPLELDNKTVSACQVNGDGEIGFECPVVCGSSCFGPICYQHQTDTYVPRSASGRAPAGLHATTKTLVRVTRSPRVLLKAYSLSEADLDESLTSVRNLSTWSSELLQRGETVLDNIVTTKATAQMYIDRVKAQEAARSQRSLDCESLVGRYRSMAAISICLSALACPLLIIVTIKLRSSANNPVVIVRTTRNYSEAFL